MLPEDNVLWYGLVGQSLIAPATLLALGSGLIPLHGKSESQATSAKPSSSKRVIEPVTRSSGSGVVSFPDPWSMKTLIGPPRKSLPVYPDDIPVRKPIVPPSHWEDGIWVSYDSDGNRIEQHLDPTRDNPINPIYRDDEGWDPSYLDANRTKTVDFNVPLAFGPSFSMGTQRNPKNRARKGKGKAKGKSKKSRIIPTRGVPRAMRMGTTGFQSVFVDRSSTSLNLVSQTPIHTVLGKQGIRIMGKQPFSNVVDMASQIGPLKNGTLATFTNHATILLSPDLFNGPLAAQANLYDHYVFRRVRVEYISTCSSAQTGAIVMGFRDDPAGNPTLDFSNVRALSNSVTFPCRESRTVIDYKYNGSMVWNTLYNNTTTADIRLTAQAAFNCCLDTVRTSGTEIPLGFLNVYYDIELYCPGTSHGFTTDRKTKERQPSPPSFEEHTSAPGGASDMVIVSEGERTLLQKLIGR